MFRNYVFTLNNFTTEQVAHLKGVTNVKYVGWAEEIGDSGTPHLQGLICTNRAQSMAALNKAYFSNKAHLEVKRGTFKEARDYFAGNSDKPPPVGLTEIGVLPMDQKAKGEASSELFAEAIALAKEGKFDEINPGLYTKYYRTYQSMNVDAQRKRLLEDSTEQHEWFYGSTGTGKSKTARETLPTSYKKRAATKWWDGYVDGDVIIEDFDKAHAYMGHDLKIWLDRYPFPAETKGAQFLIRPRKIIITSNYHPKEIWSDAQTLDPILRRLKVTQFCPLSPGLL